LAGGVLGGGVIGRGVCGLGGGVIGVLGVRGGVELEIVLLASSSSVVDDLELGKANLLPSDWLKTLGRWLLKLFPVLMPGDFSTD